MANFQSPYSTSTLTTIQEIGAGTGVENGYTLAWFSPHKFAGFDASWQQETGVFLFLPATLDSSFDKAALEERLKVFLNAAVYRNVRLLWIENPADPLVKWRTHSIPVRKDGGKYWVSRRTFLNIRNYAFLIDKGVEINLQGGTFFLKQGNSPFGFMWSAAYGKHYFFDISDVRLPMAEPGLGCMQFALSIPLESWQEPESDEQVPEFYGYPALEQLDIGIRIFFRDPEFPVSGDDFYLASHRYPVLQERYDLKLAKSLFPAKIDWKVRLDPLYPLSRERCHFEFKPFSTPKGGLPSGYRTNRGYTIHLLPRAEESRLVFTPRPATIREDDLPEAPLYLAPAGTFEIKVPIYKDYVDRGKIEFFEEPNLICGISGLEYVKLPDKATNQLRFEPDQPAFASAFLSANALLRDFNAIQKRFQREGSVPQDLPEGTDLDMEVEAPAPDGLNISDIAREAMLDEVLDVYFPDNFFVSEKERERFRAILIVEDWIQWYRDLLKTAIQRMARSGELLSDSGKTSWAYLISSKNVIYYAQPDNAVLHMAEATSNIFLDYMEVPALGLPDPSRLEELAEPPFPAFPMLPYGSVDTHSLTDLRQLEMLVLNPQRRKKVYEIGLAKDFDIPLTAGASANRVGTTPQGLIASFSKDWETITELQLAVDTKDKKVGFTTIKHGSPLKSALQSNQLFLVISDPAKVMDYFSDTALKDLALENDLDILDWVFELGPDYWGKHGTIMVFKYTDTPLIELAGQLDQWFMPDEFNADNAGAADASVRLQALLLEAIEFGNSPDAKERKKYESLAVAASQPNWTGIIMLNVHVPLRGLPDSLKALAGGMDPDLFYSQYIGIDVTQVKPSGTGINMQLNPQQSSLFGLIDYNNPEIPEAEASGYNFHVPSLSIVFQNSHIVHFAAEVYLILEKIFDEKARLLQSADNIIVLRGVAEEQNGRVSYSFGFSGANRFRLSGKTIEEVEIIKAQFATDPIVKDQTNPALLKITGRFTLWGGIRYAYLRDFDVLSFGRTPGLPVAGAATPASSPPPPDSLRFGHLEVVLRFDMDTEANTVANRTFEFDPTKITVDIAASGWRTQSVFEQFPLVFRGFVNVRTPDGAEVKTGHMPVSVPVRLAQLESNYYAMKFDLKLGSLGGLSGSKPLVAGILVAWNPSKEGLFVGLKLPGSASDKKEIILQGVLKLTFASIRFIVFDKPAADAETEERRVGYMLNLRNIKLQFFLLSFPPIGQTEMTLFGDTREDTARVDRLLGWYAAYVKK
ncbi:MAG: hypothetical protein EP344_06145 [Bacteroidetes bacterium]|nr:MAG: hypothetical protein EP344_06145 [Bacteroidota bacterium]